MNDIIEHVLMHWPIYVYLFVMLMLLVLGGYGSAQNNHEDDMGISFIGAIFWPIFLGILIVLSPYLIGRFIGRKSRERKQKEKENSTAD